MGIIPPSPSNAPVDWLGKLARIGKILSSLHHCFCKDIGARRTRQVFIGCFTRVYYIEQYPPFFRPLSPFSLTTYPSPFKFFAAKKEETGLAIPPSAPLRILLVFPPRMREKGNKRNKREKSFYMWKTQKQQTSLQIFCPVTIIQIRHKIQISVPNRHTRTFGFC